jgi:hypothetical protein
VKTPSHAIGVQTWEVESDAPERVQELQDALSDLNREVLTPLLEECFSEAVPPGRHLVLDRIELDLGTIAWERMREDIPSRLRERLRDALPFLTAEASSAGSPSASRGFPLEALGLYLQRGALPWWAEDPKETTAESLLLGLLDQEPALLKKLLLDLGRHAQVRRRLSLQFHEPALHRIIELLEPGQAPWILRYAEDWQEHQEREPALPTDSRTFRAAKWEFILAYLLADRGSVFNTKMFVRGTLLALAGHFHLSYRELLDHLHGVLQSRAFPRSRAHLTGILRELREDEERHPSAPLPSPSTREPSGGKEPSLFSRFEAFLERETSFLLPGKTAHGSLQTAAAALAREEPGRMRALLRKAGRKAAVPGRLAEHLSEGSQEGLVAAVEPGHARTLISYSRELSRTQARRPPAPAGAEAFRRIKWRVLWTHLLAERGSTFNTKAFLKSTLADLANHHNLTYGQLLDELSWSLSSEGAAPQSPLLFEHLRELAEEWRGARARKDNRRAAPGADGSTPALPAGPAALLRSWLRSAPAGNPGRALEEAVLALAETAPATLAEMLGHPACGEKKRALLRLLSPSAAAGLPAALLPGHAAFFSRLARGLSDSRSQAALSDFLADVLFPARPLSAFGEKEWEALLRRTARRHHLPESFLWIRVLEEKEHLPPSSPLAAALRTASLLPASSEPAEEKPDALPPPSHLELLEHSLRTESPPSGFASWEDLIETLMLRSPGSLADALRQAGRPERTAALLVRVLPARVLLKILKALEPAKTGWLPDLAELPSRIARAAGTRSLALALTETQARPLGFLLVLEQLLRRRAPRPHRFLIDCLQSLAGRLGTDSSSLLQGLEPDSGFSSSPELAGALDLLLRDCRERPLRAPKAIPHALPPWPAARLLEYHFRFGGFPSGTGGSPEGGDERAEKLLAACLEDKPALAALWPLLLRSSLPAALVRAKRFGLLERVARQTGRLKAFPELRRFFGSAPFHGLKPEDLEAWFWEFFLEKERQPPASGDDVLRAALECLLAKAARKKNSDPALFREQLAKAAGEHFSPSSGLSAVVRQAAEVHAPRPAPRKIPFRRPDPLPASTLFQEHQAVKIRNSGLVLLWPFLKPLWEKTGILQAGAFPGETARHRAVFLLQFLAAGHTGFPESALPFNKILCGLRPETPLLLRGYEPAPEERATCESLLANVIHQWKKLGSTSIQGLQGSFLCREGLLHETETEWILRVDQKAYDILLQFLPWQIATVKTSWMEKKLLTHWFK